MNRDGYTRSIWQDTVADYRPQASWSPDAVYDAIIIGAGITGLTTALRLQEEGKKCVIAEAHNIGYGTSSGTTAHLNTMLDTPYNSVESDFGKEDAKALRQGCVEAIAHVHETSERHGIECGFSYMPGYLIAQDDKELKELKDIVDAALRAGDAVSVSAESPVLIECIGAARYERQAQFHITRYLVGLAKAFEAAGGVLLGHCVVTNVDKDGKTFTAETSLGALKGSAVVYATHIPPGINLLHFRCSPYRSYAMAVMLRDDAYPEGLAYDMKDPYHYFRTQEVDGQRYMIAGGCDHKTGHEENTERSFTELEAYLRKHYDIAEVVHKWSSQYWNSPDGLPYIGHLPGAADGVWVGTGYGGNGMTLGTLAGIMLSDAILGREHYLAALLKPSRVKPVAGFMDFVKENADVVSQFIGKRFAYEKISTLSEIAPGEATVADWEGKKVALYKDDAGKVFAVDPVCPHAACIVGWNSAEKSWDCPCHGARYTPQGEMITGPARRGLTPLVWEEMEGD